jgi:DtxR family Mn-dependent transcriptional regulator
MSKLAKSTERILSEDALKHIYKCEQAGRQPTVQSVAGILQVSLDETANLLAKMAARHLLEMSGDLFRLTPEGQDYALQVIRAHRLWERYLADETGFAEAEWHERAERHEHSLSPAEMEDLAARLGHPTHDPHGDPIPTADGTLVPHGGRPLATLSAGEAGRIVHLEDEPEVIYAQLVAEGLHPGMLVRVSSVTPQRIRFQANGAEHRLAPMLAANISVVTVEPEEVITPEPCETLSSLKPGQTARVVSLSRACRGSERRRLMDLGILPGTTIKAEMVSPSGDPTAYRIRGALIALRKEQADYINII